MGTVVDFWSTQSGRIYDILTIPCENGGAILEGSAVKFGTEAADKIVVIAAAGRGDGVGVALKAASATTGEVIPVLFHGVYKMLCGGTTDIAAGDFVMNSITTAVCTAKGTWATQGPSLWKLWGGSSNTLGMALQKGVALGDSLLILVGRSL